MRRTRFSPRGRWAPALALLLTACGHTAADTTGDDTSCGGSGGGNTTTRVEPDDDLTPLRLLRRASITLLGVPPTDADQQALLKTPDAAAQMAFVDDFIDAALDDPRFYEVSFELGPDMAVHPARRSHRRRARVRAEAAARAHGLSLGHPARGQPALFPRQRR
ncbi:MAG: hypothetical protein QM820_37130 [Minicystis sp.]